MNNKAARFKFKSLEQFLSLSAIGLTLVVIGLLLALLLITQATLLTFVSVTVFTCIILGIFFWQAKQTLLAPFFNISSVLEAVRQEDYSLRANPEFNHGAIKMLSDEVALMADELQTRKHQYDQQAVLVLRLIEQLASPIGVFDSSNRLQHANDAFSSWCGQPWQNIKGTQAQKLGFKQTNSLQNNKSPWQLEDQKLTAKWQLRHSQFTMKNEQYQLVVLTNIEQIVYQTEQAAWHKMTRVLSHEINNSLSPIKSLAESLTDVLKPEDKDVCQALDVIATRSSGLMTFVNRYASLAKDYEVHLELISVQACFDRILTLFDTNIEIDIMAKQVIADKVLLEQVLVNLIKNAIEASETGQSVLLQSQEKDNGVEIMVIDSGAGISNFDDLFVPFYTTKKTGKGIGLSLSRNMLEQQGGKLTLQNRTDQQGVQAVIYLRNNKKQIK